MGFVYIGWDELDLMNGKDERGAMAFGVWSLHTMSRYIVRHGMSGQ